MLKDSENRPVFVKCYWGIVRQIRAKQRPCVGCDERSSEGYRCQGDYPIQIASEEEYLNFINNGKLAELDI